MQNECRRFRDLLNRDPFEELSPEDRSDLDAHLTDCRDCAHERQALTDTLATMGSVEEAPVPRHFFVYEERRTGPWKAFRGLAPIWQGVLGAAAVAALILAVVTVARLNLRWEEGVFFASFGDEPRVRLTSAWRDELLTAAEERSRAADLEWLARIRRELERSRTEQGEQFQAMLASGLQGIENRVDLQVATGARRTEAETRLALSRFRKLVIGQRNRDLANLERRLESFSTRNRIESERTDLLMTAMFGPAEPRQP
jgi:hypothetical protein